MLWMLTLLSVVLLSRVGVMEAFIHHHMNIITPSSSSPTLYINNSRQTTTKSTSSSKLFVKFGELPASPIGIGSAAPKTSVSNYDLENVVDTSHEWIYTRTGIAARKLLYHPLPQEEEEEEETIQTLAAAAAQNAIDMAKQADPDFKGAEDISLVIYSTSSSQDLFGDAGKLANTLGCNKSAMAFDLTAACSGFLFGTVTASHFLSSHANAKDDEHSLKYALVVGADALSRWVDWTDRNSCVLFGDGAGAMVLKCDPENPRIKSYAAFSNGAGSCDLNLSSISTPTPLSLGEAETFNISQGSYNTIQMNGSEVYKFATREVPRALKQALESANMEADDIDWLLLHQANIRIMETVAKRFNIPMEKVLTNLEVHGNTSAASIPLCLDEFVRSGKVKKGDKILCAGFGAGLSWGASVIEWGGPE